MSMVVAYGAVIVWWGVWGILCATNLPLAVLLTGLTGAWLSIRYMRGQQ